MNRWVKYRWRPTAGGPLVAAMWGTCATGWGLLLLTDRSAALVALTLLTAMFACTRVALASHRKTGADVSESLNHFQQIDEVIADRVLEAAVQRLAESGLIIQATAAAPSRVAAAPDDAPRTWAPDFYNGRARHRATKTRSGSRQSATVVSLDQARRTAAS